MICAVSFWEAVLQKMAVFIFGMIAMPPIIKKKLEDYKKLCYDKEHWIILTPDGIRFSCEAHNDDLEAIRKHLLETTGHIQKKIKTGGICCGF